jgi:hypothetical protein
MVKDRVTGLKGMLTHAQYEGGNYMYAFQPHGLNPKNQEPVDGLWIAPDRISDGVEVPIPQQFNDAIGVLGSEVEDQGSGFKGIAVAAILHISGCVHIDIQPSGVVKETGEPIKRHNFDIRRLHGKAIKQMSEAERDQDQERRPSPAPLPRRRLGV